MFNVEKLFKKLFSQLTALLQTKLELNKLKAVDKGADFLSSVFTKLVFIFVIVQIIILFNIGLSIWLGYLFGNLWLGFFSVAAFYLLVLLLISVKQKSMLHFPVKNYFIRRMLS